MPTEPVTPTPSTILTVEDLKAHLHISGDADDDLLARKIGAAEAFTDRWLVTPLADLDPVPEDLKEAIRLLVGHLYENREASLVGISADMLPLGFWDLIGPHRAYSFGA